MPSVKIASKIRRPERVIQGISHPFTPDLMVHKWRNVFESSWGMKGPINRLPGSGLWKGSMQHYSSAKQHSSKQCLHLILQMHWVSGKANQPELHQNTPQYLWDPAQRDSLDDAKSSVFLCQDKNTICIRQFIKKRESESCNKWTWIFKQQKLIFPVQWIQGVKSNTKTSVEKEEGGLQGIRTT